MTRRLKHILLLPTVLVLGGCAGTTGGVEIIASDGHTLVVATGSESGSDAAVEGTLALTEGSCWGVELQDGSFMLILWPEGTSPSGDGIEAPSPAGTLAVGVQLRLSGGEDLTPDEVDAVSEACGEDSGFRAWKVEEL
jgi:hypothetical protein